MAAPHTPGIFAPTALPVLSLRSLHALTATALVPANVSKSPSIRDEPVWGGGRGRTAVWGCLNQTLPDSVRPSSSRVAPRLRWSMRSLWTWLQARCQLAACVQEACSHRGPGPGTHRAEQLGAAPLPWCLHSRGRERARRNPCSGGYAWLGGPGEICRSWLEPEQSESIN